MPRHSPFVIMLPPRVRRILETRSTMYTAPYMTVIRAKIVLYAADGLSNDQIAARLDTPRQVVSKWRKRFFEHGLEGLLDRPRHGPATDAPDERDRDL